LYKVLLHNVLVLSLLAGFSCKVKKESNKNTDSIPSRSQNQQLLEMAETSFGIYFIGGCSARMKGNLEEALELFKRCLQLNPSSAAALYEMATVHKLLAANDLALNYAKQAVQQEPKNIWFQLLLADCYRTLKQYTNSVKVHEQLVKFYPENLEFKENLAIEYSLAGNYTKSFEMYEDLEKRFGINEQITVNKIKILSQQNKLADIEKEIRRLVESGPANPRYLTYLAEHYENTKQLEKAKDVYYKILEVDPNNPTVRLALSDYYKLKNDEKRSFEELQLAFLNPELDAQTKYNIANLYYKTAVEYPESSYFNQGLELATNLIRVHPGSSEAHKVFADFMFFDKKYDVAANYYYLAVTKDKSDYKTWERLLVCDKKLSRFDSLEKHSYEALELFPGQPMMYLYNGLANIQIQNYKKAAEILNDGMAYVVDDPLLLSGFLSNLGDVYHYLKEFSKSDKAFDDALKINSDYESVLNNYAYYLAQRRENLDKAEQLSKRSIELKPNEANYMDTYGWILYLQGKYILSAEWLQKAISINPSNPNILEHYGDCLYKLNKIDDALINWEKAIQAGGNKERLSKKLIEKKLND